MSARVQSGSGSESAVGISTGPTGEHGLELPPWQRAGCLRNPCSTDPDPALFFASPELRQIRDSLLATMAGDTASLSVVSGGAGIGKTALLRELEMALTQQRRRVVFLSCAPGEAPGRDVFDTVPAPAVLLLDDVEQCEAAVLDELERWLLAGARPGLHVVLSARPEAAAQLQRLTDAAARAGLATASVTLEAFDTVMVGEFLAHRLWRSGFTGAWPLAEATVHRIADRSGGVPARILALAGAEFETAWAEAAVFAPRRAEAAVPMPAPAAPVPTVVASPQPRRRALSDPAVRTALAATALLAVAGTAGWLAWRTVETARVGVVEVAPPAAPPGRVVAIVPPARTVEPPNAAPARAEQKVAAVAAGVASPSTAEARPLAEPTPPVEPGSIGSMLLAARTAEPVPAPMVPPEPAPKPRLFDQAKANIPPAEAATLPVADGSPKDQASPATETVAATTIAASVAEEREPAAAIVIEPVAAAPPALPSTAADQETTRAAAAEPVTGPASEPPLSSAEPPQLAQAAIMPPPATESTPVVAPAADPPKPEDATAVAPAPPPPSPSSPGLPAVAPSAGAPPAATAPAPRLTPAQIASYVRRGDEYVQQGDIAAARLWYERAATAGDAEAMRALGRTFDPRMLRQWGVVGMPADQARADEWYRKAAEAQRAAPSRQQ